MEGLTKIIGGRRRRSRRRRHSRRQRGGSCALPSLSGGRKRSRRHRRRHRRGGSLPALGYSLLHQSAGRKRRSRRHKKRRSRRHKKGGSLLSQLVPLGLLAGVLASGSKKHRRGTRKGDRRKTARRAYEKKSQ